MMQLTFIIVTRDRPLQLRKCVESIRRLYAQDSIVVVDNSQDPSGNAWLAQLPAVVHLINDTPRPPGESRNMGVASSQAETMFFLDDDAWLESDVKPAITEALQHDDKIAVVGFPIWETSIDRQLYGFKTGLTKCFAAGAAYFSRQAFDSVEGFDPLVTWSEEFDISLRLWGNGHHIWTVSEPMVKHHAATPVVGHSAQKIEQIAFSRLVSVSKSLSLQGALLLSTRMLVSLGLQRGDYLPAILRALVRFLRVRSLLKKHRVDPAIENMFRKPDLMEDEFSVPLYYKLFRHPGIKTDHS